MLQDLSLPQLEQALTFLKSPQSLPLPPELKELNPLEWMMLERLLQGLMWERENNPLH